MKLDFIKIVLVLFGATGFWKLIEILVSHNTLRKLKNAETRSLDAQSNNLIVENWVQWSEKMEKRIEKLESKNALMNKTIIKQRERINELQKYVDQLEEEVKRYKNNTNERK